MVKSAVVGEASDEVGDVSFFIFEDFTLRSS